MEPSWAALTETSERGKGFFCLPVLHWKESHGKNSGSPAGHTASKSGSSKSKQEVGLGYKASRPAPTTHFLQQRWRPWVQTLEPVGEISHSDDNRGLRKILDPDTQEGSVSWLLGGENKTLWDLPLSTVLWVAPNLCHCYTKPVIRIATRDVYGNSWICN